MTQFRAMPLRAAAVGIALAVSTAASAADLPSSRPVTFAPPPAPVFSWTGAYIGISAGGDVITNPWQTTALGTGFVTDGVTDFADFSQARARLGGYIGYNYQIDQVVIGVEGDGAYDFGHNKTTTGVPGTIAFVGPPDNDRTSANSKFDASARVRLGITVMPTLLVYATGGAAFRDASYSISCPGAPGSATSWCGANEFGSNGGTRVGWTVGGGAEAVVYQNLVARIEYRFSDFGNRNISFFGSPVNADFFGVRTHLTSSTGLVGLAYKFDMGGIATPVVARY